jgi:acyl-ACP thioesterase
VYQKKFPMSGLSGQVRPGDLAREMEKITEEHLGILGLSRDRLKAEGKIWVIAWTQIHISRLPALGEQVILRIWPGKMKAMMQVRKYAFYTAAGEPLACAASIFVMMDANTRGFAAPSEILKYLPVVELPGEPDLPPMRLNFPSELGQTMTRTVAHEEIDLNGHLNNTHYLDWADGLMGEKTPTSLWVQYVKELMEGQEVTLRYELGKDGLHVRGSSAAAESFLLTAAF